MDGKKRGLCRRSSVIERSESENITSHSPLALQTRMYRKIDGHIQRSSSIAWHNYSQKRERTKKENRRSYFEPVSNYTARIFSFFSGPKRDEHKNWVPGFPAIGRIKIRDEEEAGGRLCGFSYSWAKDKFNTDCYLQSQREQKTMMLYDSLQRFLTYTKMADTTRTRRDDKNNSKANKKNQYARLRFFCLLFIVSSFAFPPINYPRRHVWNAQTPTSQLSQVLFLKITDRFSVLKDTTNRCESLKFLRICWTAPAWWICSVKFDCLIVWLLHWFFQINFLIGSLRDES